MDGALVELGIISTAQLPQVMQLQEQGDFKYKLGELPNSRRMIVGLLHDLGKRSLLCIIEDLIVKDGMSLADEIVDMTLR